MKFQREKITNGWDITKNVEGGRLTILLQKNPFPTTIILHWGTNDIFKGTSHKEILKRIRENLLGIPKLLPNTNWLDILVRVGYSEEQNTGVGKKGKKVMRHINKATHKMCREEFEGDNKVIVHSGIFRSGRNFLDGKRPFEFDCMHPSEWGLLCLRDNWSNALIYFNQNPSAFDYNPGSVRLQH